MKTILAVYTFWGFNITSTEIFLLVAIFMLLAFIVVQTFGFVSRVSGLQDDFLEERAEWEKSAKKLLHNAKEDENSKHELRKELARLDASIKAKELELKDLRTPRPIKNEDGRWIDGRTGQYIKAPKDAR